MTTHQLFLRNEYDGLRPKKNEDQLERYLAVEVCIVEEANYVAKSSTPNPSFSIYICAMIVTE